MESEIIIIIFGPETRREFEERLFRQVEELDAESTYHFDEMKRLDRELKWIQDQLQTATDKNTKKQLQHEISITQVKRDIAGSKREQANALTWQRSWERALSPPPQTAWVRGYFCGIIRGSAVTDVNEDRAGKCSILAKLWEDKVKQYEDNLKKLESI